MNHAMVGLFGMICICASGCNSTPDSGLTTDNQDTPDFGPLISATQLHKILESKDLVILDLGPEKDVWIGGHIPGALYVDWVDDITDQSRSERYTLIDKDAMEKLLGRLGITKNSLIVLYDDLECRVSTRMYWSLRHYGLSNIHVLDGGRKAWMAGEYEMSTESPEIAATVFKIESVNEKLSADLDFIADRLQDPNVSLVDGRPASQFSGDEPGKVFHTGALHKKRGHIPGAINIFWKNNFNVDGTFKSVKELEQLYEQVTGSDLVVTYCNEGLHAAPPWFVLSEILGHGNVRVYDDSLSEWANSDQPTETGDGKE